MNWKSSEADEARKPSFTSFSFTSTQYCYSVMSCKRRSCTKGGLRMSAYWLRNGRGRGGEVRRGGFVFLPYYMKGFVIF